jgi:hypothetical protein
MSKRTVKDRILELALEARIAPEELGTISLLEFVQRLEQARHNRVDVQEEQLRHDPSDDGLVPAT